MTPNIIPSIFTAIDELSVPVKRMGLSLKGLGIQGSIAGARIQRAFAATSTKAMQLGTSATAIGAGLIIPLGLATKAAVDFQREMGDVATIVDTNVENMDEMGDAMLRLAKKIPKPIADLSKGLYQIRSDGWEAGNGINQAFGILESSGKLAVAGLATVEEAAESVTSAMQVFKDEGLSSIQVANSFFKTVQTGKTKMNEINQAFGRNAAIIQAAGVTLEEFNAMTATMTMTGMKAANAQVGIGQTVTALIKPSTELTQVYESLGYTGADAFKKIVTDSKGLVPAMERIDAEGKKLGISFGEDFREKRAMMTDLLLTGTLHEQYKRLLAIQMDGQDTLNEAFVKQQKTAAAQMQLFNNHVRELGISVGNLLIPALTRMMGILTPVIDGIADFAKKHKLLSGAIVGGLAYFGMFAVAVGGVSLAVATVTKGFWILNGAIKAYSLVSGFAAVKTGAFNMVMAMSPEYIAGANVAMMGINTTLAATAIRVAAVTGGLSLIIAYHKEIASWANDNRAGMAYNYAIGDYEAVRESLKNRYKSNPEETRKFVQEHPKYNSPAIQKDFSEIDRQSRIDSIESTFKRKSEDAMLRQDSADRVRNINFMDSVNKAPSVPYTPKSQSNNITVTIENNSGNQVSATQSSGQAAPAVPIKIISTATRKPAGVGFGR